MKRFVIACCNSKCLDYEFKRLAKIVYKVPGITILPNRNSIVDDELAVTFITKDYDLYRLHGTELIAICTCENVERFSSEFMNHLQILKSRIPNV